MSNNPKSQAGRPARNPNHNREVILQTITDLVDANQKASRRRVAEITGLRMATVDDHIGRLRDEGLIHSLYAGVFDLVDTTPDRPVSLTAMPRGRFKLEIGDGVCEGLTPREAMAMAKLLAGQLLAFGMGV